MLKLIKFSWPKLVYGILLTIILFLASLMTHRGCGVNVPCPQIESDILLYLTAISTIYVLIIIVQKIKNHFLEIMKQRTDLNRDLEESK